MRLQLYQHHTATFTSLTTSIVSVMRKASDVISTGYPPQVAMSFS